MDGGANDEGWHNAYCGYCNKNTEHGGHSSGSYCVTCDDRQRAYRARQNVSIVKVGKYVVKTSSYYSNDTLGFNAFNDDLSYWECDNMNNPNTKPGEKKYPKYIIKN